MNQKKLKNINWLINIITLLFVGFFCWVCLREWYVVGVKKKLSGYPFGGEGPVPYYYKTPDLYLQVNQIWAILFLALLIICLWSISQQNVTTRRIILAIVWLILGVKIFHGLIGVF